MIIRAIRRQYEIAKQRGWDRTYWAVDLHGTLIRPNYRDDALPTNYYADALEAMRALTARTDYLPIDLKRQGRAEVHIPLFYPTSDDELREMFVVLARKLETKLDPENVPEIPEEKRGQLSGADIEGILGRAWRKSLLGSHDSIQRVDLQEALDQFIPMAQSLERELQILAAIVECTDQEFLPAAIHEKMGDLGGRDKLQERLQQLKAVVDGP